MLLEMVEMAHGLEGWGSLSLDFCTSGMVKVNNMKQILKPYNEMLTLMVLH